MSIGSAVDGDAISDVGSGSARFIGEINRRRRDGMVRFPFHREHRMEREREIKNAV